MQTIENLNVTSSQMYVIKNDTETFACELSDLIRLTNVIKLRKYYLFLYHGAYQGLKMS